MSSHTEWSYEGTFLSVSRVANYSPDAPTLDANQYMHWSVASSPLLNCHKSATYVSAGGAAPAAPAGGAGGELAGAEEYLAKHRVNERLQDAVNTVLATMPPNALEALSQALAASSSSASPPAKAAKAAAAAPAAAPAAAGGSEEEIKAQGDLVRTMKEANKATPGTHSKEELDAAVAKLKELKGGGAAAAPKSKEDKKKEKA
eukprot:CAMPEP_0173396266 /NCGR_PEP_ID=MMETSP1356-20130122/35008_1 /TAXON_ID=77927 ORGANISM="Hemiselmis virescens, Strain PCC157" /NCGR_SAMPLE_ID=MMETSP1356 /ASSEMBLY_ACC=CAM_ASM_000847 /LENGTH=202 /DNA_ID=CAMNT_0014355255 /DNA_START=91 /DNA_END=695 /DNA_ORIENTATION=-